MQLCACTVVACGCRVVIRTHAVCASGEGAIPIGGVGATVVVIGGRFEAAERGVDALSNQRGRGVVVERIGFHAPLVKARAVVEGGARAVVIRVGLHAPEKHSRTAVIIKGRRRVKCAEAAVHTAALDARAVVHHGKVFVVLRSACGAAVRWGLRRGQQR